MLSSDNDDLYEYIEGPDELVMSPHAKVSDRTEVKRLCSLDQNVLAHEDGLRPARDRARNSRIEGNLQGTRTSREGMTSKE